MSTQTILHTGLRQVLCLLQEHLHGSNLKTRLSLIKHICPHQTLAMLAASLS